MHRSALGFIATLLCLFTFSAQADTPLCMAKGQPLPINNEQVLNWKFNSKNTYKNRGNVEGIIGKVYKDKTGHRHFQVIIGENPRDTIEIIYNQSFGKIPSAALTAGAHVQACGDYITAKSSNGKYRPSPDGAIIHWVHRSPASYHDHGFVVIDDVLYGMDKDNNFDQELPINPEEDYLYNNELPVAI